MWTTERLRWVLTVLYGANKRRTGPDTAAVAEDFHVTPRTVQRWLSEPDETKLIAMPDARLEQLMLRALPDTALLRQETHDLHYAREQIHTLSLPGRGGPGDVPAAWIAQGWLEPHRVILKHYPERRLLQIRRTRMGSSTMNEVVATGKLLGTRDVATRFHAVVVVNSLLHDVQPWRIHAPAGTFRAGRTYCWFDDAPHVDLPTYPIEFRPRDIVERDGPLPGVTLDHSAHDMTPRTPRPQALPPYAQGDDAHRLIGG